MNNFSAIVALAAIMGSASAFWGTGHLLVSRSAQAILEKENPAVLAAALEDLAYLKKS